MTSTTFPLAREDISLLCRGRASVFIVSPPGIHISLGICVWGYTYHGDTHITVTPKTLLRLLTSARAHAQFYPQTTQKLPKKHHESGPPE